MSYMSSERHICGVFALLLSVGVKFVNAFQKMLTYTETFERLSNRFEIEQHRDDLSSEICSPYNLEVDNRYLQSIMLDVGRVTVPSVSARISEYSLIYTQLSFGPRRYVAETTVSLTYENQSWGEVAKFDFT
jgi:hypothetical protein